MRTVLPLLAAIVLGVLFISVVQRFEKQEKPAPAADRTKCIGVHSQ